MIADVDSEQHRGRAGIWNSRAWKDADHIDRKKRLSCSRGSHRLARCGDPCDQCGGGSVISKIR